MIPGLLVTKLHRPALRTPRVDRPRLVERLDAGLRAGHSLFLVSAPAGFGKTTCVCAWLEALDLPNAWLALDPADDEPGRFYTYLLAALQSLVPGLGEAIEAPLLAGQTPLPEVVGACLVNDLFRAQVPAVLALDDLHLLQDPAIFAVLNHLAAAPDLPLRLVLLTREDPSLPLARLRAGGRLTELRAADLRFSAEETADFLNRVAGLELVPGDTSTLAERTEGWIAGLQLAALSLRDRPPAERAALIGGLSGSQRFILGYLTEEVLNRLGQDRQDFLLKTSLLERMCGELCDAALPAAGSAAVLSELDADNLFLVPLDDEGRWYRYHHLFAGLLRERVRQILPAEETAALHRRASAWFRQAIQDAARPEERAAYANQAVLHALAAADYPGAVRLIEEYTLDMLMQWQTRTVSAWLSAIPPEWSRRSPKANLAFAWNHLLHGSPALAAPYLERLGDLFAQGDVVVEDDLRAEWLALQATLSTALGRPEQAQTLANQALELASFSATRARGQACTALAGAALRLGEEQRAGEIYRELIAYGQATGDLTTELMGQSALGLLWIQQGRLRDALEVTVQAEERARRAGPGSPPILMGIYGELGQVYYLWNRLDLAGEYAQRAAQIGALSSFSDAELYQAVMRSRIALVRGDLPGAEAEIGRALARMRVDAATVVREEVLCQQARVYLAQGRRAEAESALTAGLSPAPAASAPQAFPPPPPDPQAVIGYAQGVLYNTALRVLLARGDTGPGLRLAGQVRDACRPRGFVPLLLETGLLCARLLAAAGDLPAALDELRAAVVLAEPEGFVSPFLEEGPALAGLLARLPGGSPLSPDQADFVRRLLAAFPGAAPAPAAPGGVEPLTAREREVLALIAAGLTYAQITARLYISLNTVRSHVKAIYGKLGVNNRTMAIEEGRRRGEVGESEE